MHVQAGVVQNLDNTRTQINALISSSQSASGALQATQSGNQIMGLPAQQLADSHRASSPPWPAPRVSMGPRKLETQAQSQQQMQNFLNYGAGYQPGSAQMFH